MKYYPIFLQVTGRPCVVVGGGRVAQQKAESLLTAGAGVTLISPTVTPALATLVAAQRIIHHRRHYTRGDLRGCFLAYAATDDADVHADIAREADATGVLLNVVDQPELCSFIVPSVMERGDLVIATSTSGTSPALAKRIRQDLEEIFGAEYALALQLLGRLRERLAQQATSAAERQRIFATLVDSPLVDYLRGHQTGEVDRLLAITVGEGVSLASLGMELS
jgi:precorrin-2 dehydrogenase/sirohydrochlorin ferrochelatase